jgi:hypothetical protein
MYEAGLLVGAPEGLAAHATDRPLAVKAIIDTRREYARMAALPAA